MKYNTLLPTLALIAKALTIEITSDTITRGSIDTEWHGAYVAAGADWSIINNDHTYFNGNLNVDGGLYIKAEPDFDGLTVSQGALFSNEFKVGSDGIVVVDSRGTDFTAFYSFTASQFDNQGKIWLADAGDAGVPTLAITSQNWNNDGIIHAYQDYRSLGWLNLGYDLQSITNNGAICLQNTAYRQANKIVGNGCIDIGKDSTVWLAYTLYTVADQTLIFSDTTGSIRADAWGANKIYNVVGFGDDNVIGMSVPIKSYSYNGEGILKISDGITTFSFNIGTGYDESKFEKISADYGKGINGVINGGIKYNGAPVNTARPSTCPACLAIPDTPTEGSSLVPSSTMSTFETSTLATSTISSVTESSSDVATSSDESSSAATSSDVSSSATDASSSASSTDASSSAAVSSDASSSEITSAASSSASDASASSDVSASSDGVDLGNNGGASASSESAVTSSAASASSEITDAASSDAGSSAECTGCTEYTTGFTTTESSGAVVTGEEDILITTLSDGEYTTITSIINSGTVPSDVSSSDALTTLAAEAVNATTVSDIQTTVVTITSCSDNKCQEKAVTTGLTTVSDETTVYTTYCPLTTEAAEESSLTTEAAKVVESGEVTTVVPKTTVVTITSCADNGCEESLSTLTTEVTSFITLSSPSVEAAAASNGSYTAPEVAPADINAGSSLKPFSLLFAVILAALLI